mmetsp:Transcript_33144/g.83642  ORF Transcript_33144/g.83642 Transcript_33144/m.83642 type:complete len:107 (+) Transcript_33144:158-478(+)
MYRSISMYQCASAHISLFVPFCFSVDPSRCVNVHQQTPHTFSCPFESVSIDLDIYVHLITAQNVTGADLQRMSVQDPSLSDDTLSDWGVSNKYHRRRILRRLAALR